MILKNKYRSAMEKIEVTPQMEERILSNVSRKREASTVIKKQQYLKWIRPASTIAACCAVVLGAMAIYPSLINNNGGNKQIQTSSHADNEKGMSAQPETNRVFVTSPIENMKGIDELKKAVPFELFVPGKLPTGYKLDNSSVISGKLAQIIYSDGSKKITYRVAKGAVDISGNYTSYEENDVEKIGDIEVTLKGSNSLINLATWIKDDCSYSLSFSRGIEKNAVILIIESMEKA
ncbi:DUF4367 domain-containing protein [Brevibacillus laterosporus]|uniref:DUF4367 domain-containing protein n=1 Tax=Brevibacillus laterosporus TaxID=1465 RepID=UPI0035A6DB62